MARPRTATPRVDVLGIFRPFSLGVGITVVVRPANGTTITRVVGAGFVERLVALRTDFVTDATVATRQVTIRYRDADSNTFYDTPAGVSQAASLTVKYSFAIGVTTMAATPVDRVSVALPDIFMPPGFRWLLNTTVLTGADAFSFTSLLVEQFPIGGDGYDIGETTPAISHLRT